MKKFFLHSLCAFWLCVGFVLPTMCGCTGHKMNVKADADVNADVMADVFAEALVTPNLKPGPEQLPVKATSLPHRQSNQCNQIAVVDVDGMLVNADATGLGSWGENPVALFRERLDAIECNHQIRAVVLRINSPGGSVTASDIMWRDLLAFKERTHLPVIACCMDVTAGGGYYLATGADRIVAHPTSVTGAIGCILNLYNLQDMMAQFNVIGTPIKAGKNIDLGSPIKAIDEERRKLLQTMADEYHERFCQIVKKYRPQVDQSPTTFDGRVFTTQQAMSLHLVDEIGYLDDAVEMAGQMSGCSKPEMIFFHRPGDPAHSPYAMTPNIPLQSTVIPVSIPGLDRSRLPSFLYLWQIDPGLETRNGK